MKLKKYENIQKVADICLTEFQSGDVFVPEKGDKIFIFCGFSDRCENDLIGVWFSFYGEGIEYNYDIVDIYAIENYKRIGTVNFGIQKEDFKFLFKEYLAK